MNFDKNTNDIQFMQRAYALALQGFATVSPNPLVGAVIVKDGKIIGEGHHQKKGGPHAEVVAVNSTEEDLTGATLYCTLEPCCHTNKLTPPCVDLIIEKKFSRVVVASTDPNPEVRGKGLEKLKEHGIEVKSGVLEKKCNDLNKIFFKNMNEHRPYVHLKVACTLDGRMASTSGSSKWITSSLAREEVHHMRLSYDAVMVGRKTVINDNPLLTARIDNEVVKEPVKLVVGDLDNETLRSDLFSNKSKVINIFSKVETPHISSLKKRETWDQTFEALYQMGVTSVLVEGGPTLISSLIEERCFDKLTVFMAPKLIGNGKSIFESEEIIDMERVSNLEGQWRVLDSGEAVFEVGA